MKDTYCIIMTDRQGGRIVFDWIEDCDDSAYFSQNWEDYWSEVRALAFTFGKSAILYRNGKIIETCYNY